MKPLSHLLAHLRRNGVAYVALFAALGTGSAYAAGKIQGKDIAANAIRAKHIKNGQVRRADLAADAVDGGRIADDSITGADIDESTLVGLAAPAAPAAPATPVQPAPEPDLSGFPKVVAKGFIAGSGPLSSGDRCNKVGTTVEGVGFSDMVVVSPVTLVEDVVFTASASADFVTYQACYTGPTNVNLGGDVRFMVLRAG